VDADGDPLWNDESRYLWCEWMEIFHARATWVAGHVLKVKVLCVYLGYSAEVLVFFQPSILEGTG